MDHMFIMRLAALLFGGGIASCLFPGKSRMSHVLFLLLVLAETAVAHATIPDGWWFLLPGVVSVLLRLSFKGGTESGKGGKALLSLHATDGTIIRYYYWFSNFLVYGGAGSGKTKSIGKPLMSGQLAPAAGRVTASPVPVCTPQHHQRLQHPLRRDIQPRVAVARTLQQGAPGGDAPRERAGCHKHARDSP